jgi:hypothetical protein
MEVNRTLVGKRANHFADTRCSDCAGPIPMGRVFFLYEQTTIRQEVGYKMRETELVRACWDCGEPKQGA